MSQLVLLRLKLCLKKPKCIPRVNKMHAWGNEFLKVLLEFEAEDFVSKSWICNKPS